MTEPATPVAYLRPGGEARPGNALALPSHVPAEVEALLADPVVVRRLLHAYDENETLIRANEQQRLAEALFAEADKFSKGAFVDGIKHAASRLLDPSFAPMPAPEQEEEVHDRSA